MIGEMIIYTLFGNCYLSGHAFILATSTLNLSFEFVSALDW